MAEITRKAKLTWKLLSNAIVGLDNEATPVATAGDANSYQFVVTLDEIDGLDLTGYKLTTFYSARQGDNNGMIPQVEASTTEDGVVTYTIDLPVEMMQAGQVAICFTLSNEDIVLGSVIYDFTVKSNLITTISNIVNNNPSDIVKALLAQLPTDVVDRLNAQLALIAKKADQTSLDATNATVALKADKTSLAQKLPIVTSDASSTGLAYTVTNTNIPTLVNGYSFKFIPSITSTVQTATLAVNAGTAYPFAKANSFTGDKVALSTSNAPVNFLKSGVVYTLTFTGSYFAIAEEQATDPQSLTGPLPVAYGGNGNPNGLGVGSVWPGTVVTINSLASGGTINFSFGGVAAVLDFQISSGVTGNPSANNLWCHTMWNGTNSLRVWAFDVVTQNMYTTVISGSLSGTVFTISSTPVWRKTLDENSYIVGTVLTRTANTAPSYSGTWTSLGNATIGSKTVYYWERTA